MNEEVEKENQKLKTELEKKDIDIIEAKEANRQLSVELQKKDKIIDLMAKQLTTSIYSKEWVKQYFEDKVRRKENENIVS